MKYFNTAGLGNSLEHYMIEAATRLQVVEQFVSCFSALTRRMTLASEITSPWRDVLTAHLKSDLEISNH